MPEVIFSKPFYDGNQRYREGEPYQFESLDGLPKTGIRSVDGKDYKPEAAKKQEAKTEEKPAEAPAETPDIEAMFADAVAQLTPGEEAHWTTDGRPEVKAINNLLEGVTIKAADRDRMWAEMKK